MKDSNRGNIFIISAASGTGKTTLVSRLLNNHADLRVSVSHTTRAPREGEQNGVHYHFVSKEEFEALIAQNAFLEHANVFGNYYGTSIAGVNALSEQGFDVILEIDVQGAEQVRRTLPEAHSIFILPPSFEVLAARLKGRATDSEEVIRTRLSKARHEIEQAAGFDYIVVNDDLAQAEADLLNIVRSCRLQKTAQQGFLANLLENF
ncbi:guanylate kinase [Neisseria animalis]|uniref:Guanylate kinase n=1 Tax=Neisseria animalis TaxID=492 RepID=A0A5P3MQE0_NEIAN|nr:guanylate kinase [Neisseria animalis]QEY23285.1 guanylate kinase [Neisseria animalis]ROW31961.1 guanylate kinase [Neisseria animalis]VEE08586.1 guanylate kinase [Neisseria animalis]